MKMYRCFLDLGVHPASSVVKVDDTEVGVAEGLNAGCWSVGVALTGNVFGLDADETDALSDDELEARRAEAYGKLTRAGAHFIIDSVADLPDVLDEIEGAMARGERP
jgi:phosphonoacetaldehyde hydrolase